MPPTARPSNSTRNSPRPRQPRPALQKQRKLDEAIACFRKATEIDPNYAKAHYKLGNALSHKKKLHEAIAAYRKAIEIDPKYVYAYGNLGLALHNQKKRTRPSPATARPLN